MLPELISKDGHFLYYSTVKLADGETSTWVHILPVTTVTHPKHGTIEITPERIQRFAQNINSKVRGIDLDVDYDHKEDPAKGHKAAGWIKQGDARDDGLWGLVDFTPTAADELRNNEWRYMSAEYMDQWEGKDDVLFGAALTNRPFMKSLAPINFKELVEDEASELHEWFEAIKLAYDDPQMVHTDTMMNMSPAKLAGHMVAAHATTAPSDVAKLYSGHEKHHTDNPDMTHGHYSFSEDDGILEFDEPVKLRDISADEKKKHPDSDFAGANRSFPIFVPEDVSAAAHSLGRAGPANKSTSGIKAAIIRIAKRKGAAFTAKLPKAWKVTASETEEVNMDKILAALKLAEGADEDAVVAAIQKLQEPKEEDKAKKFAEDYPEEAKQLAEEREKRIRLEVNTQLSEWHKGKRGIPPALDEAAKVLLRGDMPVTIKLSDDTEQEVSFKSFVDGILKTGLVDLTENKTDDPEDGADPIATLHAKVLKYREEHKDASAKVALEAVTLAEPALAQAVARATRDSA